jgi:hypothetical protein
VFSDIVDGRAVFADLDFDVIGGDGAGVLLSGLRAAELEMGRRELRRLIAYLVDAGAAEAMSPREHRGAFAVGQGAPNGLITRSVAVDGADGADGGPYGCGADVVVGG